MSTELDWTGLQEFRGYNQGTTSFLPNDYSSKKMNDSKSRHNFKDLSSGNFRWENAWRTQEFQFKKLMEKNLCKLQRQFQFNPYMPSTCFEATTNYSYSHLQYLVGILVLFC